MSQRYTTQQLSELLMQARAHARALALEEAAQEAEGFGAPSLAWQLRERARKPAPVKRSGP